MGPGCITAKQPSSKDRADTLTAELVRFDEEGTGVAIATASPYNKANAKSTEDGIVRRGISLIVAMTTGRQ